MIQRCDALVMPSRWEGFGLVALEAMRLGKPVIASRRGALTEIIEHGATGLLFDLDRPGELIDVLRHLDKVALAAMGVNARQEFLRSFTSERMNAELVTLYRTLLETKAARGAKQPIANVTGPTAGEYSDAARP
jgi:glycosyltransferase involved in cell wall biosynthesis